MRSYVPHTDGDIAAMLRTIGAASVDELFSSVPVGLRDRAGLSLAEGLGEPELRALFDAWSRRNAGADPSHVFVGAGCYPHHLPTVVDHVTQRSEFATAYTPYQAEVSQGTLQSIFEFQTFVALLMGLDVANASMYDGASAMAEAVLMSKRLRAKRERVLVSRAVHPQYRAVLHTYLRGMNGIVVSEVPIAEDGRTSVREMEALLGDDTLCVVVGYPNVLGIVEDLADIAERTHAAGGMVVTATGEALALAALRSPGSAGADIAVAEGQSLGIPPSYGGPGLGLFATREAHVRAMPGRVVGETEDRDGRRGYVLTLATREQHIRRERATSNICTNQGLCALAVTVYLSLLGRHGLAALARRNAQAAHEVADRLRGAGLELPFSAPFFNEFVVRAPAVAGCWETVAAQSGVVAGYPLGRWFPELTDAMLVCVTEVHTPAAIDRLCRVLSGAGGHDPAPRSAS